MRKNMLLIIMLFIINATVILNSSYVYYVFKLKPAYEQKITGSAISSASLCFDSGSIFFNLFYPEGEPITQGTINISVNVSGVSGITNLTAVFSIANGSIELQIAQDTYNNDYYFNTTLNTASYGDGNCNYRYRVVGLSNGTICSPFDDRYSSFFTIDNNPQEPSWNNFRNSYTTNFSLLGSFTNLSGIAVGNSDGSVNFSGYYNFDAVNFDSALSIGQNSLNLSLQGACFEPIQMRMTLRSSVQFVNVSIYRNGINCTMCSGIMFSGGNVSFNTTSFGNYSIQAIQSNRSTNLSIFDDTDPKRGNQTKTIRDQIGFYANFTDNATQSPLTSSAECFVRFNTTGIYNNLSAMSLNVTSSLFQYSRNFTAKGNYSWNVYCTHPDYQEKNVTDYLLISNSPPDLIENISNLEMRENSILTGLDLDDYFEDIDNDNLSYSYSDVANVLIVIASNGIVSFIPDSGFFGLRRVVFYANDSTNITPSNNVTLTITEVTDSTPPATTSSSSSGGGGGGGASMKPPCIEEWFCDKWSVCVDGIRTRSCWDLNTCSTFNNEPPAKEVCEYIATCYNGLLDENEELLDCGGPCAPCFTCFDRQLNQDETDIDCGGKTCKKCVNDKMCLINTDCESDYCTPDRICAEASCHDGFQNQDEQGIDCGGLCARKCPQLEQAAGWFSPFWLIFFIVLLATVLLVNIFRGKIKTQASILYYKYALAKAEKSRHGFSTRSESMLKTLSETNAHDTLHKFIQEFERYLAQRLHVSFSSSAELQRALQTSNLPMREKQLALRFHSRLLRYRSMKLRKRDVTMIIQYGKRLAGVLG